MQKAFRYIPTVMLVMLASPAFAEEKKSPMPQMDEVWFANQLFWLAVSFILLYVLVSTVIVPTVTRVIGARRDTVASLVGEAESMKNEALAAREHYETVEANARKDASRMVSDVTAEMNRSLAESQTRMDADLKKRMGESDSAIAAKLAEANAAVVPAAASLAAEIYSQVLGKKADAKAFEQALADR